MREALTVLDQTLRARKSCATAYSPAVDTESGTITLNDWRLEQCGSNGHDDLFACPTVMELREISVPRSAVPAIKPC